MRKKQSKSLILLLALIVVLAVLLALIPVLFPQKTMELVEPNNIPVYSVAEARVTGFRWSYEGQTYRLTKGSSGWYSEDAPELAVDQTLVKKMLENIYEIKANDILENPADISVYGLDNPDCTITVISDKGEEVVKIGIPNGLKTDRYVSNGDGKIYLVSNSLIKPFQYTLAGIAVKEDVPYISTATAATLTNADGTVSLEYRLIEGETYGWFAGEEQLNSNAVLTLLRNISFLDWESCVAYDAAAEDLSRYGLDAPVAVVTAVVEGQTATFEFGGKAGEDAVYVKLGGSSYVYTVSAEECENILSATLESLKAI